MSIVLVGSTSGSVTLQEPAVAGTTVLDLPATSGTVVVTGTTPTLNGITFPATVVPSADANTLDDYEEGTFTPTCVLGITSPTYSKQLGTYTKIGNMVHIQISIVLSGGTRNADALRLGGTPFTSANFDGGVGLAIAFANSNVVNSTSTNLPLPYIDAVGTVISFYNTVGATFVGNDLAGANFRLDLAGSYLI